MIVPIQQGYRDKGARGNVALRKGLRRRLPPHPPVWDSDGVHQILKKKTGKSFSGTRITKGSPSPALFAVDNASSKLAAMATTRSSECAIAAHQPLGTFARSLERSLTPVTFSAPRLSSNHMLARSQPTRCSHTRRALSRHPRCFAHLCKTPETEGGAPLCQELSFNNSPSACFRPGIRTSAG